eukprot:TRINITY_DN32086_c0_g1_i1.p1 TRINITY_DN32086_c0_g1~~TRINITY_DN32086_c0_g1_i1.p1  ORF type:complete len:156 (+),score=21.80 TRINITY_DN32086_c0_g1_i1:246-713(+)
MKVVESFDFQPYRDALVNREKMTPADADRCVGDLKIILSAMEREPDKTFALTVSADNALHGLLLDTVGAFRLAGRMFGAGKVFVHNPYVFGTPEYDIAWANTRSAFAEHGIDLPADYRKGAADRAIDAEVCFLTVRTAAEVCFLSVRPVAELVAA